MARTIRHGGARDGRKTVDNPTDPNRNPGRGYRFEMSLRRDGDTLRRDHAYGARDNTNDRRGNNRIRRAADRAAIRAGLAETDLFSLTHGRVVADILA